MHGQTPRPLGGRRGRYGVDAGERLVEHQSQRVQVGLHARDPALRLLGRHVCRRADDVAGERQAVLPDQAGHPEVGELDHPGVARRGVGQEHVRRLEVAVHDAVGVGMGERIAQGVPDPDDVAVRQPPVLERDRKRVAAHQLGDQVGALVVDRGLIQGHDPRVRQLRGRPGLAFEPALGDPLARHDLDRDVAIEALVAGQPDRAEGPGAQTPAQRIAAEHEGARIPRGTAGIRLSPGDPDGGEPARADGALFHTDGAVPLHLGRPPAPGAQPKSTVITGAQTRAHPPV